jgi:hypothetical protein
VVKNYVHIIFTNIVVSCVGEIQFANTKSVKNAAKNVHIYLFVIIRTEKKHVNYVNKNVHVSITKPEKNVTFVTLYTITVNTTSINIFVEYVLIGLTVFMINTNLGVRIAEEVPSVNLRFVTRWLSNTTIIIA